MILDKGICSIFSVGGTVFAPTYTPKYQSWYGELNFETAPAFPTAAREEVGTSARIRVLQNRSINNGDALYFSSESTPYGDRYDVTRAFHGIDDDSGELITDLTLRRVS